MNTHAIRSTQLLAITAVTALSSLAGCAATSGPPPNTPASVAPRPAPDDAATGDERDAVAAPVISKRAPEQVSVEPASHVTTQTVSSAAPPEPLEDEKAGRWLLDLREELFETGRFEGDERGKVSANVAHFRPLCDAQGYPVVGNVMRKDSGYQPSRFCSDLRVRTGAKPRP